MISEDGFCYIRHRSAADARTEYWTCDQRGRCPGREISRNNRREFEQTQEHNHLPDRLRIEMLTVKADMKRTAANAVGADTTSNVLQAGLLLASGPAKTKLPRIDHLKRNIHRSRNRAQVPLPLPYSRDEIDIPLEFQVTGNLNYPASALGFRSFHKRR